MLHIYRNVHVAFEILLTVFLKMFDEGKGQCEIQLSIVEGCKMEYK